MPEKHYVEVWLTVSGALHGRCSCGFKAVNIEGTADHITAFDARWVGSVEETRKALEFKTERPERKAEPGEHHILARLDSEGLMESECLCGAWFYGKWVTELHAEKYGALIDWEAEADA